MFEIKSTPVKPHAFIAREWRIVSEHKQALAGWWTLYLNDVPIDGWDETRREYICRPHPAFDSDGTYRMATTEKHPWHSVEIVSHHHGG